MHNAAVVGRWRPGGVFGFSDPLLIQVKELRRFKKNLLLFHLNSSAGFFPPTAVGSSFLLSLAFSLFTPPALQSPMAHNVCKTQDVGLIAT